MVERYRNTTILCFALCIALIILSVLYLKVGAKDIDVLTMWHSLYQYDAQNTNEVILLSLRLPRLCIAVLCGVSFAVAGALMQGITNNPMASPSIMGVNAGAGLGLAIAMILVPNIGLNQSIFFSFGGAAVGAGCILFLSTYKRISTTPVFLALAGTAISAVFVAITQALVVYFGVAQELSYWTAGGISGVRMSQVEVVWPWTLIGLVLALRLAPSITLLNFGEDIATGLGSNIWRVKILAQGTVLILAGAAVAAAGPVGFVGLVTPHIARKLVGIDYRKIIPVAALLGALLIVLADILARTVAPPFEIPLGVVTALVGVPFFLYLANRKAEPL